MAPASVNRHLATLRSVSKLGRMLGLMSWYLEVPGVKAEKRRQNPAARVRPLQVVVSGQGDTPAWADQSVLVGAHLILG